MRSAIASTKRSWMPPSTISRDEAVQRWPVEKIGAVDRAFDRGLQVGVVEHDQRVLAAHLELELAHRAGAGGGDPPPGRDRAGEGDGVDLLVVEHRLADHRAAAHDEVEHARRAGRRGR